MLLFSPYKYLEKWIIFSSPKINTSATEQSTAFFSVHNFCCEKDKRKIESFWRGNKKFRFERKIIFFDNYFPSHPNCCCCCCGCCCCGFPRFHCCCRDFENKDYLLLEKLILLFVFLLVRGQNKGTWFEWCGKRKVGMKRRFLNLFLIFLHRDLNFSSSIESV